VTLHHLKQTQLGHQPIDLALKHLTRASNLLNDMFVRRALVETNCPRIVNGEANQSKSFILTHGVSLVQYDPRLAHRDPHLFDGQVIVKTHMFWGNRDHEVREDSLSIDGLCSDVWMCCRGVGGGGGVVTMACAFWI
jgi:hypothetical protein